MVDLKMLEAEKSVFRDGVIALKKARIPFVLAGAFGIYYHTGIWRDTKDMDVFLQPADVDKALDALRHAGFRTEMEDKHWLAKAFKGGYMVDLIFGEGNWMHPVDREWMDRSHEAQLLGETVRIAPVEEIIWSKSFVVSRDRFDGADIVHLIRATKGNIDWHHLLDRFGPHWQVLFMYLNLFLFVYPSDRGFIPNWVLHKLMTSLQDQMNQPPPREKVCYGTLLDRLAFLDDVDVFGYRDARELYTGQRGFSPGDVAEEQQWARNRVKEITEGNNKP